MYNDKLQRQAQQYNVRMVLSWQWAYAQRYGQQTTPLRLFKPITNYTAWDAGVVICLKQGADLHTAQLMPLPITVSCFSKIQIG